MPSLDRKLEKQSREYTSDLTTFFTRFKQSKSSKLAEFDEHELEFIYNPEDIPADIRIALNICIEVSENFGDALPADMAEGYKDIAAKRIQSMIELQILSMTEVSEILARDFVDLISEGAKDKRLMKINME